MLEKLKDLYNKTVKEAAQFTNQRATMRACMMGPRAVGKTTILTAIFHNTNKSISQTGLKFIPDADTQVKMNTCNRQLEEIFEKKKSISDRPLAGIEASQVVNVFRYQFGLKGKHTTVDLEIKDFPGEYVDGGLHAGEIDKFVEESNAIFIAIDTPHMMEYGGEYCEAKNKCSVISDYFNNNLKDDDEKLILFVPLKCEKYYYERRMDEVNTAVKKAYRSLIDTIETKKNVSCAITPILTIGGVVFDVFQADSNGNVLVSPKGLPEAAYYKFYDKKPKLNPMFCVQPLYYILSYVTHAYEANKGKGNIVKKFFTSLFNLFSSDIDLLNEIKKVTGYMLKNGNGYEIIQGKDKLI